MELDENTLQGFWSEDDNEGPSFFIINEAIISKLCILGEDVEPCFEGSQITRVQFSFEESMQKKLFNMMEQVKEIIKEGGNSVENEVKNPEMEEEEVKPEEETPEVEQEEKPEEETPKEPEVEAPEKEEEPEEEQPEEKEEVPEEEGEVNKYNLDEIQEYIELKANYEKLETQFNEMKADYDKLVEFKNDADRKEKQAMIDQFYMLSNEDKKDVIENIDNYSVDEIEAKLSVICVRNKVSFDLDDDNEEQEKNPTSIFNLENDGIEDDITPAWIKAALATKKEME